VQRSGYVINDWLFEFADRDDSNYLFFTFFVSLLIADARGIAVALNCANTVSTRVSAVSPRGFLRVAGKRCNRLG
jgi:hypothetical protein